MNFFKLLLIAFTALTIGISGEAFAKKTKTKQKKEHKVSQSREINTNKQSKSAPEQNVRGKDRAAERKEIKESRENVNSNKQSKEAPEENVRGQDRADERHEMKEERGRGNESSNRGGREPRD